MHKMGRMDCMYAQRSMAGPNSLYPLEIFICSMELKECVSKANVMLLPRSFFITH